MHLRTACAWSRIGLAAAIVARPERIGRSWIGPAAADPSAQGALRSVAVRDACLGAAAGAAVFGLAFGALVEAFGD